MITITNQARRNKQGETLYHIYVNNKLIAEFWHRRSEKLAVCLERAAEVVREIENKKWIRMFLERWEEAK